MYMEINGHFHTSGRFTSEEKKHVYQNNILYCTKTCLYVCCDSKKKWAAVYSIGVCLLRGTNQFSKYRITHVNLNRGPR